MLRKSSIGHRKFLHAEHCRYGTRDLSLINAKSSGMVHRQWEPARVFSGYSVRKACIGSILVARRADSRIRLRKRKMLKLKVRQTVGRAYPYRDHQLSQVPLVRKGD
jgi:hypothetical protein